MAEVDGNRTHHPAKDGTTGFEVRAAHQAPSHFHFNPKKL